MEHIDISEKLYGREKEISVLKESFSRASLGNAEVLLVPGHSGAGKTVLVNELRKPVKAGNGILISGKFEQYQQNVPYFAFRQALAELCLKLQSEDERKYNQYRSAILQALGTQTQVLIDLVPEFELFLGKQPPLDAISPQEARHRFAEVMRNFLEVVCRPEHPLVLFIDDWQWANISSFELLKQLKAGGALRYLLIIVAYRDNEIQAGHLLHSTIKELKRDEVPIRKLLVQNIPQSSVVELLNDALTPAVERANELAEFIFKKTEGNPYFVKSLIFYLFDIDSLWYDGTHKCWKHSIDGSKNNVIPENIVALFVLKLNRLHSEISGLLSLAACLGNRFNIDNLSIISQQSIAECIDKLSSAMAQEVVMPLDIQVNAASHDLAEDKIFMFRHDRLQQAAMSLINASDLPGIRLKIGKLLLERMTPEQINDRIFDIVQNLNAGCDLIVNESDRVELVALNMQAARKAYAATAYNAALQYYTTASQVLELHGIMDYVWEHHCELGIRYFKERAQCEFLEGDPKLGEQCIEAAVSHSENAIERADILNILIVHHTLHARYPEAIEAGREALKHLDIYLPEGDYEVARDREIALVRERMKIQNVHMLADMPVMSNPEMLMACKILITMGPPCYRSYQKLWSVIVPKVVGYTLHYGNIPQVGYSHTAFGGLLGWVDNDYAAASEFSDAATKLMTTVFHSPPDQSVFYLMIGSSIRHWFKHLKYGSQDYMDAYEIGLRSGNLQYAAYAFGHNMYCRFYQGVPLDVLISETRDSLEFSRSRHNQWAIDLFDGGLMIFESLRSTDADGNMWNEWDEDEYLLRVDSHLNIQITCIYKILKTYTLLLNGQYEDALALSDEAEHIIFTVGTQGLLPWPEHVFSRFLIITALFSDASDATQSRWRGELENILIRLRTWSHNGPDNFEHKFLLASAEMERVDGNAAKAMSLYGKAIDAARDGGFVQWVGMANERYYLFWHECGNDSMAHIYWQQAYLCYSRWGASAKVGLMEVQYQQYIYDSISKLSVSDAAVEQEYSRIQQSVYDRQIEQIRSYSSQMQQSKMWVKASAQAEELARATEMMRTEIAVRKASEEALRKSEERFHSLFVSMYEGVVLYEFVYENDRPANYRIVDVNHSHGRITGRTRENSVGILGTEYYNTDTPPHLLEYHDVATSKRPYYYETYDVELGKHMAISVVPWQDGGFATIITDITDRKKAEEDIAQKNKDLQRVNAEKDKFFTIVAHDLKTPFNSIMGFTEMLLDAIRAEEFDEMEKYAEIILHSSRSAVNLLHNLLEWSRAQTGRMIYSPETLDLMPVIYEVNLLLAETAGQKGIQVSVAEGPPVMVHADKAMVSTVLRNLVSNAIKFTKPGGDICVFTDVTPDEVIVSVKDSGIGLEKAAIDKLFRIDENYSTPGTQNEKGTGLGLIICREFVEKHRGRIWVESAVEDLSSGIRGGSTFSFSLPNDKSQIIHQKRKSIARS